MITKRCFTVLGAHGWIGSALVSHLLRLGESVTAIGRQSLPDWLEAGDSQGFVIFAIGLTADFRRRPYATAEAHVTILSKVLQKPGIKNLLYLSSTRVYHRSANTNETVPLPCLSSDPSDLYNLSKLFGESLVLQKPEAGMKVVRISNVIGPSQPASTFIGALLSEAKSNGSVTIHQSPITTKDYIALSDLANLLPKIAMSGRERLYNVGTGVNTSHSQIANWLEQQGISARFSTRLESGPSFPLLDISKLLIEFDRPNDPFNQILFHLY